jgi:hypothetical protein
MPNNGAPAAIFISHRKNACFATVFREVSARAATSERISPSRPFTVGMFFVYHEFRGAHIREQVPREDQSGPSPRRILPDLLARPLIWLPLTRIEKSGIAPHWEQLHEFPCP